MSESDLPRKFRNRRAHGSVGLPQSGKQRPWWQRVFGKPPLAKPLQGKRGAPPIQPLGPTLLDPQTALDSQTALDPQLAFQPGNTASPTQRQGQRIEPLRVSGNPVALPRQHHRRNKGSRVGQPHPLLGTPLPSGGSRQKANQTAQRSPEPLPRLPKPNSPMAVVRLKSRSPAPPMVKGIIKG